MNLEHFVPAAAVGILIPVTLIFVYIYSKFKEGIYLAQFYITGSSLLYLAATLLRLYAYDAFPLNSAPPLVPARIFQELSAGIYMPLFPYFLSTVITPRGWLPRLNRKVFITMIFLYALLLAASLIHPENFLVFSSLKPLAEPAKGPLFFVRDMGLALIILYSILVIAVDIIKYPSPSSKGQVLLGFGLALFAGASDLVQNHRGHYIDPLAPFEFSRVALGIMCFILFSLSYALRHFLGQAKEVERSRDQLAQKEKHLQWLAYHDELTDLPNQSSFFANLPQALARAAHQKQSRALFLVDIDSFTGIVEAFGQGKANHLLSKTAQRLKKAFGGITGIYRVNDNEFALLSANHITEEAACLLAEGIREEMNRPFTLDSYGIFITACIGYTVFPQGGSEAEELFQNATSALRIAQQERNSIRLFSSEMTSASRERIHMVHALKESLERGEFAMVYQPIYNQAGHLAAAEALVRWTNPEYRQCSPGVFVPLAEISGLIIPLSQWVLTQVLRDASAMKKQGINIPLALNLSPRQFKNPRLSHEISQQAEELGITPERISFEITETELIENHEETRRILQEFREKGYALSIDDFGTGYSSLSYLKNLPVNKLKIDKSFIQDIPEDPKAQSLVKTIIDMSSRLRFLTIAEGVETEEQLNFLLAQNCSFFQGFLLSRPLRAKVFFQLAAAGQRHPAFS